MITRKFVTLVLDIDTEVESHPHDWDWPTLLDIPSERILRVEVFSVGTSNKEIHDKEQASGTDDAEGLRSRSADAQAESEDQE